MEQRDHYFSKRQKQSLYPVGGAQSDLNGNYLTTCTHYIHQNPLKAGLVEKLENWKFSSFNQYIDADGYAICNRDLLLSLTAFNMNNFYEESYAILEKEDVEAIW